MFQIVEIAMAKPELKKEIASADRRLVCWRCLFHGESELYS